MRLRFYKDHFGEYWREKITINLMRAVKFVLYECLQYSRFFWLVLIEREIGD